jgi:hypothetical protein
MRERWNGTAWEDVTVYPGLMAAENEDLVRHVVDGLRAIGEQIGATVTQVATAWVLRQPGLSSAIVGSSNPDRARSNALAGDIKFPDDALKTIDEDLIPRDPVMAYIKPPVLARRLANPMAMRLGMRGVAALTVAGRRTGEPHKVPVIPVEVGGSRYLVAPYGESEWVRNLRAGQGRTQPQGAGRGLSGSRGPSGRSSIHHRPVPPGCRSGCEFLLHEPARRRGSSSLSNRLVTWRVRSASLACRGQSSG